MEDKNTEEGTVIMRVPVELEKWVEDIQAEFEKIRGFKPNKPDVVKNILKQFRGKFIV